MPGLQHEMTKPAVPKSWRAKASSTHLRGELRKAFAGTLFFFRGFRSPPTSMRFPALFLT